MPKTKFFIDERNMEIKRKFEQLTVSKRRFLIRQTTSEKMNCAECGEPMLPIAQAAVLLGIKQSRIFRIVETGGAHFTEPKSALMICLNSFESASASQSR